jgi:hypothetical protein
MGDLTEQESAAAEQFQALLREVEVTAMTKSFKMVLLEALLELDGLGQPVPLQALAQRSRNVLERRRPLLADLPDDVRTIAAADDPHGRATGATTRSTRGRAEIALRAQRRPSSWKDRPSLWRKACLRNGTRAGRDAAGTGGLPPGGLRGAPGTRASSQQRGAVPCQAAATPWNCRTSRT